MQAIPTSPVPTTVTLSILVSHWSPMMLNKASLVPMLKQELLLQVRCGNLRKLLNLGTLAATFKTRSPTDNDSKDILSLIGFEAW